MDEFSQSPLHQRVRSVLHYKANSWLKAHKFKAFYMQVDGLSFEEGATALLKACGIGKLRPNILLMGHKADWQKCPKEDLDMYFEVLQSVPIHEFATNKNHIYYETNLL